MADLGRPRVPAQEGWPPTQLPVRTHPGPQRTAGRRWRASFSAGDARRRSVSTSLGQLYPPLRVRLRLLRRVRPSLPIAVSIVATPPLGSSPANRPSAGLEGGKLHPHPPAAPRLPPSAQRGELRGWASDRGRGAHTPMVRRNQP